MGEINEENLELIFRQPEKYLGTIERNTEIKVVYRFLQLLGWHGVEDIDFAFQIPREKLGAAAKAAHAADFALFEAEGFCAVGEAKQWFVSQKEWASAEAQIKRYQLALKAPRAFVTCGWRWVVLGECGHILLRTEDKNPKRLTTKLAPYLQKGSILNQVYDAKIRRYGTSPARVRRSRASDNI